MRDEALAVVMTESIKSIIIKMAKKYLRLISKHLVG